MSGEPMILSTLIDHLKQKLLFELHVLNSDLPIEDEWTKKLTEHRYKLIYTMCQPIKVMDYLESVGIIPRTLCSRILQEYRVPEDRNRALIDFIHSRAQNAFNYFLEALYLSGNEHLVLLLDCKFLLSDRRQRIDAEFGFSNAIGNEILTSTENEKTRKLMKQIETLVEPMSTCELNDKVTKFDDEVPMGFTVQLLTPDVIEQYSHLDPTTRSMKCYRMLSRPRGQCLLINNVDEFKTMDIRQGSDIDASKLRSLFEQMGFDVLVQRNLNYTRMVSALKNFADLIDEEKENCDCAIVIILSHGSNGRIYAVDELSLDVDEQIIGVFDDHLIGKPKIFIFQACRGARCNYSSESKSSAGWSSDTIITDSAKTTVDGGHSFTKIPKRNDMVIWYSTLKDFVSWRQIDEGSVFIQSLITVFARTAWCYDLGTMSQCVTRTMTEKIAAHESTPFQTSCFESHLRYPLYFNPGYFEQ